MHVLPAPIILTQPSIDRIQACRIAEYRRYIAEVVVERYYVLRLRTYINVSRTFWRTLRAYTYVCVRTRIYARMYEVPN